MILSLGRARRALVQRAGIVLALAAALTAAVMCGVQLAANYWAFLYLAWIGPLLVVSMLADPAPVAQRAPTRLRSLGRVGRLRIARFELGRRIQRPHRGHG